MKIIKKTNADRNQIKKINFLVFSIYIMYLIWYTINIVKEQKKEVQNVT